MARLQGFTWAYLNSLFAYDPLTGIVTRKIRRGRWLPGEVVGTEDGKGYLHVSVDKVFIRLHRLAYFLHHRKVPRLLDHEDRDRLNNRIKNLRPALKDKHNAGNTGLNRVNTSGFKGVSFNSRSGMWHAQIKIDGKQTYLGRRGTRESAARLYNRAALKHFGEFAFLNDV